MGNIYNVQDELEVISKTIKNAKIDKKTDLTIEVIWSAMNYLKENKKATIEEACVYGLSEWIK